MCIFPTITYIIADVNSAASVKSGLIGAPAVGISILCRALLVAIVAANNQNKKK